MKPTEFIVETSMIAQEADTMHADHEVQMARADCYNAAKYAIELHKLLKNMSESQGLDGWVSEKITLANDYLHMVHEYLKYENAAQPDMMEFAESAADYAVDQLLAEERTETKNDKGEVTSWKDESDWRKSNKDKSGRGKVTNLSDKARRETERLAKKGVAEGLGKDIKRLATGQDVKSRARQEIAKSQDASMKGDTKTSKKHFDRYDKLDQLANKEQGVALGKKIAELGEAVRGVQYNMSGMRPPETQEERNQIASRIKGQRAANRADTTVTGYGNRVKSQRGAASGGDVTNVQTTDDQGQSSYSGKDIDPKHAGYAGKLKIPAGAGKKIAEMATGGGSSSAGVATSMSGPAGKPGTGKPKQIANAHKPKKITVGKGVY